MWYVATAISAPFGPAVQCRYRSALHFSSAEEVGDVCYLRRGLRRCARSARPLGSEQRREHRERLVALQVQELRLLQRLGSSGDPVLRQQHAVVPLVLHQHVLPEERWSQRPGPRQQRLLQQHGLRRGQLSLRVIAVGRRQLEPRRPRRQRCWSRWSSGKSIV